MTFQLQAAAILLFLIFGILTNLYAQPEVKLRNLEPAPGSGYEIKSGSGGTATWTLDTGGAITVNLTPIGYVPASTGNGSNLNEVVIDPNGDTWIIDSGGNAIKIAELIDGSETQITAGTNISVSGTGTAGDPYVITATGGAGGGGSTSLTVTDGLTYEALGEDTLIFAGSGGIIPVYTAGSNTITNTLSINTLTEDISPDSLADYVAIYDDSEGVNKKVLLGNLPITTTGESTWLQPELNSGDVNIDGNSNSLAFDTITNFSVKTDAFLQLTKQDTIGFMQLKAEDDQIRVEAEDIHIGADTLINMTTDTGNINIDAFVGNLLLDASYYIDISDGVLVINKPTSRVGLNVSNPQYTLDILNGGLRLGGQSASPTGGAGVIYQDSDDNRLYHHDNSIFNILAYQSEIAPGAQSATGWIDNGDNITLVTSSDEVRIGNSNDRGNFDLQVQTGVYVHNGDLEMNGSDSQIKIRNSNAVGKAVDIVNTNSNGTALFTKSGWPVVITADGTNSALRVGPDASVNSNYRTAIGIMPSSGWNTLPTSGIGTDGGLGIEWRFVDNTAADTELARIASHARDLGAGGLQWDGSIEFSVAIDHTLTELMRIYNTGVGIKVTDPLAVLDVDGDVRIREDGILLDPQATAPASSEGNIYKDSGDEYFYGHDGASHRAIAYNDEVFGPGYGELYTEIATGTTDTITLDGGQTKTIVFESQGITANTTLTDSTITVDRTGDYIIDAVIEYEFTGTLPTGSCQKTQFELWINDVFNNEGSANSSFRYHSDANASYPAVVKKRLSLSANDVIKLRVTGSCTNHQIFIIHATFGATWLGP